MTVVFSKLGLTRDSALWLWLKVLSVATLVNSGLLDIQVQAAYLGIHLSVTTVHWIQAIAVVLLYVGAQNGNSGLPGKNDPPNGSVSPLKFPPAAVMVLALGLGGLAFAGCAGNKAPSVTPAPVLSAVKAAEVVKALDAARDVAKVVSDAYPNVISAKDFQTILTFHTSAVTVIGATPNGWKPAVEAALDQVQKDLSPAAAARIGPYLSLVKTLVDAFVPAGAL